MESVVAALSLLLLAAAPPTDFKLKHHGSIYSYEYGWPKEAVAIPTLNRKLAAEMKRDRSRIVREATSAFEDSKTEGMHFPEVGYETFWTWQTAGTTPRLLSLEGESYEFTGGAHGNPAAMALLWDRTKRREISVAQLFRRTADYAALRPAYCKGLDAERRRKRGGDGKLGTLSEFDRCPNFSDLVAGVVDQDRDGRFDALRFTANPYLAGPYAEGMYVVDLPVSRPLIADLRPEYRRSFEVQRQ